MNGWPLEPHEDLDAMPDPPDMVTCDGEYVAACQQREADRDAHGWRTVNGQFLCPPCQQAVGVRISEGGQK